MLNHIETLSQAKGCEGEMGDKIDRLMSDQKVLGLLRRFEANSKGEVRLGEGEAVDLMQNESIVLLISGDENEGFVYRFRATSELYFIKLDDVETLSNALERNGEGMPDGCKLFKRGGSYYRDDQRRLNVVRVRDLDPDGFVSSHPEKAQIILGLIRTTAETFDSFYL